MNFPADKIVFLDRDGVLNRKAPPHEYIRTWAEFELLPGVTGSLSQLNKAGFRIFVVTNQRGIARGKVEPSDLHDIHERLRVHVAQEGACIEAIYCCPHDYADRCECRKPQPGMLLRAARENGFNCAGSWMIGDSESDMEAGRRAGCRTVLIRGSNDSTELTSADFVAASLPAAVEFIIAAE